MKETLTLAAAATAISIATSTGSAPSSFQTHPIVPEKELIITDLDVVESPLAAYPGPFSFGHLIEQLAEPGKTSEFVRNWLSSWESEQMVNKQTVPARDAIREKVIEPWMKRDGFEGSTRAEWEVNLANAPFRLLAIVNRIDSGPFVQIGRREIKFGAGSSAIPAYYGSDGLLPNTGEARFIYAANDSHGEPLEGGFTIIFEYRLPIAAPLASDAVKAGSKKKQLLLGLGGAFDDDDDTPNLTEAERTLPSRLQAARYAADWHTLGTFKSFDAGYLCALSSLTAPITDRTDGRAPNLAQLRTNEGALAPVQEAREYGYASNKLQMRPVAATPAIVYNSDDRRFGRALGRYVDRNQRGIMSNTHTVPLAVRDPAGGDMLPFRAGSSLMPKTPGREAAGFRWDATQVRYREALRRFSLNTCSGCHCGETNTTFYHVHPRRAGEESKLSKFLQLGADLEVDSLSSRGGKVEINEMGQRIAIFEAVLNPAYDQKEIYHLVRDRTRRAH